jgi:hypothetical protein
VTVSTDVFIQSFININTLEISKLLNDEEYYLNRQKNIFIVYLTECFNGLRRSGDTKLNVKPGRCTFKDVDVISYTFVGDMTNDYLELNIHAQNGNLTGLTECYCFTSGTNGDVKGRRLYIDPKRGSTL